MTQTVERPLIITNVRISERRRSNAREYREYYKPAVVYLNFKGENIYDNLMNRRSRPWRELKPLIEEELRARFGAELKFDKLAWRQRAGCSCPCSPGYVLMRNERYEVATSGRDIWVTVEMAA